MTGAARVKGNVNDNRDAEKGLTLLECLIAAGLLLTAVVGVLVPFRLVISQNNNQGELQTRSTEFGEAKMEQLLALQFFDNSTNTTVYPPAGTGGTGLGGSMGANTTVGTTNLSTPASGYYDYLDISGNETTSNNAVFMRGWSITTDSTGQLKTISVQTQILQGSMAQQLPANTIVCMKASYQ